MLRTGLIAAAPAALVALLAGSASPPALAGPPWKDKGRDHDDEDHRGGPPPWAPAHGYRRKHEHKDGDERRRHARAEPKLPGIIDIGLGRCNRGLIGAVIGGVIGSQAAGPPPSGRS